MHVYDMYLQHFKSALSKGDGYLGETELFNHTVTKYVRMPYPYSWWVARPGDCRSCLMVFSSEI